MDKMEKLSFVTEEGEAIEFYIVEQTRIGGVNYILVTDTLEDEGDAWIMKDSSKDGEEESIYSFVQDDQELDAVGSVFASMLEDVDLER